MPAEAAIETEEPEIVQEGAAIEVPPEAAATAEPEEPRKSRAERRAERASGYDAEAREARAQAAAASERSQRLEVELAELRGRVTAGETSRPDPHQQELTRLEKEIENTVARMGQGDATAVPQWHDLRRQESRLVARIEAESISKETEKRMTDSMPKPIDPRASALLAEFPFLQDDPEAKDVANGHVARLVRTQHRDMKNPSVRFSTLREAAALAAQELGLGETQRAAPSAISRARASGTSSGDSGAGSGAVRVSLTKAQERLAELSFRDKSPEEAHIAWWQKIGKKIANK